MLVSELKNEDGSFNAKKILVKPTIGFAEKQILCLNILENCIETDDNGMVVCNFFIRKLVRDINIVKQYSDIEISDDNYIYDYDFLNENGLVKFIENQIAKSEIEFIDSMIKQESDQRMKVCNSIEGILASRLQQLIDKIPDEKGIKKIMNDIPKVLNKIKPENLQILQGLIDKQGEIN